MAKHSFHRTPRTPTTGFLLLAVLGWGLGITPSWAGLCPPKGLQGTVGVAVPQAGQQPAQVSPPSAQKAPTPGPKKAGTAPTKSSQPRAGHAGATPARPDLFAGRRDPFKIPEVSTGKSGAGNVQNQAGAVLPPGNRGLVIAQLKLEGVVRQQPSNKMIAVVTNQTNRAYFLAEGDAVFNGVVSKITPDAVYFKENVLDPSGKVWTRDVMKRLGAAPGEER